MRRGALIAGALAAACGGSERRPPAPPAPPPEPRTATAPLSPDLVAAPIDGPREAVTIRFDWGAPCRVHAIQDNEQRGQSARFEFDVVFERAGDRFRARLEN